MMDRVARCPADASAAAIGARITLALCGLGAVGVAAVLASRQSLGIAPPLWTLVLWGVIARCVLQRADIGLRHRFGAANTITAVRGAITSVLAGLVPVAAMLDGPQLSLITVLAAAALALDGVDGLVARARDESSTFGARFDMETDALLALIMAMLIWRAGETGVWVLALGSLRYVFLAAARALPALNAPLFPSTRRKSVCVVQIAVLTAALSPLIEPPLSSALLAIALAALVYSFARDSVWLLRRT